MAFPTLSPIASISLWPVLLLPLLLGYDPKILNFCFLLLFLVVVVWSDSSAMLVPWYFRLQYRIDRIERKDGAKKNLMDEQWKLDPQRFITLKVVCRAAIKRDGPKKRRKTAGLARHSFSFHSTQSFWWVQYVPINAFVWIYLERPSRPSYYFPFISPKSTWFTLECPIRPTHG